MATVTMKPIMQKTDMMVGTVVVMMLIQCIVPYVDAITKKHVRLEYILWSKMVSVMTKLILLFVTMMVVIVADLALSRNYVQNVHV
jgi:hypothetical protein